MRRIFLLARDLAAGHSAHDAVEPVVGQSRDHVGLVLFGRLLCLGAATAVPTVVLMPVPPGGEAPVFAMRGAALTSLTLAGAHAFSTWPWAVSGVRSSGGIVDVVEVEPFGGSCRVKVWLGAHFRQLRQISAHAILPSVQAIARSVFGGNHAGGKHLS